MQSREEMNVANIILLSVVFQAPLLLLFFPCFFSRTFRSLDTFLLRPASIFMHSLKQPISFKRSSSFLWILPVLRWPFDNIATPLLERSKKQNQCQLEGVDASSHRPCASTSASCTKPPRGLAPTRGSWPRARIHS